MNLYMRKVILIMGMTAMMFSCSTSPLDKKVNKETMEEDMVEVRNVIDSVELDLMFNAMKRSELGLTKDMEEMTYRELLDSAKKWQTEDGKVAEQNELGDTITVVADSSAVDSVTVDTIISE